MNNDFEMPGLAQEETQNTEDQATSKAEEKKETPKYPAEELLRIFDEMIFSGTYVEKVNIRGGKLKVSFKTRSAEEVESIGQKIDTTTANLMATLVEKRSLLNLHYALVSYQGTDLSVMKVEDRIKFINKLPAPIVGALMIALHKFDEKIYEATKEGEANF